MSPSTTESERSEERAADFMARCARIADAVQLHKIDVAEAQMRRGVPPEKVVLHMAKSCGVQRATSSDDGQRFRAFIDLTVLDRSKLPDREGGPTRQEVETAIVSAFHVRALFAAEYSLPDGFVASDQDLAAFAEMNASFNVWPYWREFVQASMSRMGLDPVIVPVAHAGDFLPGDDT